MACPISSRARGARVANSDCRIPRVSYVSQMQRRTGCGDSVLSPRSVRGQTPGSVLALLGADGGEPRRRNGTVRTQRAGSEAGMTTGLRFILLVFALVGFSGTGASLAIARQRQLA